MSDLTQQQKDALKLAVDCIIGAAAESEGMGAPSGVVYAVLIQCGMTMDMYVQILGALQRRGKIVIEHDLIYLPKLDPSSVLGV